MADNDNDRVWKMMKSATICMLASWDGRELHSRPMASYVRQEENTVYFLTDANSHKDDEIAKYSKVCLAYQNGDDYASVSGHATVSNDRAKIKELFGTPAKAWWDSPEDPNIRVLKVQPVEAEFWDGQGKVISYAKMAIAAITGNRPEMGDNKKVAM